MKENFPNPLRCGELFNLVAIFHSDRYHEGWDVYGDPGELMQRYDNAMPQVKALLGKINTWKMWVLCDREPIKEWSRCSILIRRHLKGWHGCMMALSFKG